MPADVFFWPLPAGAPTDLAPPDVRPGLRRLVVALGFEGAAAGGAPWPLQLPLGAPGRPAPVPPAWAREVGATLAGAGAAALPPWIFATDSPSIATRGLDTAAGLRDVARAKGFGAAGAGGLAFTVGDDPDAQVDATPSAGARAGGPVPGASSVGILAGAGGLALLSPLRPHPHLGVTASVAALGLDLSTREAKLDLHRGIRPQVDTPLCAGCGSCLDVCLYDAIVIRGGRATIDHHHCTGCGECMGVCFMAGIAPEAATGVATFRDAVVGAAAGTAGLLGAGPGRPLLCLNFLVHLETHGAAGKARRRLAPAGIGILASRDPVAVDAAAFDLLAERLGGPVDQWSGYAQPPGLLLECAEAVGLGSRDYRLREV
ncbi:MAG: hypothetical protein IPP62_04835 [bacterium]|nr:hypothetical protein [bacterium]